jgi:type I restriction enzyme M protein
MPGALNKPRLDNLANEIWKSAERLRGKFKAYEYQSVILPLIVIRRLECVLLSWRGESWAKLKKQYPDESDKKIHTLLKGLEQNPKLCPFSNSTDWTLAKIYAEDHMQMEKHFREYLNGFSKNVEEIIDNFNYRATVGLIVKNNRLAPLINQYKDLEVGPDTLSNLEMGYVYEELLRRFSEQSGEEAGEHFTPREVIRLMVELLDIPDPEKNMSLYDPACGTGGMLSVAKEHLLDRAGDDKVKLRKIERFVSTYGQELHPANYAICKSDLLIKNEGHSEVHLGNSLIPHDPAGKEPGDQLDGPEHRFDFMLSNPPFGVTWGGKDGYEHEAKKYSSTRYKAGMPRVNDGALLFLQTMLAKMKPANRGGSRIAIIFNGSPLSNGDAGSGESEIRRWILENDWLDAIVMLPDQLFYNTGIFTYIWLLRNEKPENRRGRVALIDARKQFEKEPKAFGNKRNRMTEEHRAWIEERYRRAFDSDFSDENVKVFRTGDFGYHKVDVVFWQTDENDQPITVTESYEKAFTDANLKKELEFHDCELSFKVEVTFRSKSFDNPSFTVPFTVKPGDSVSKTRKEAFSATIKKEYKEYLDGLPVEELKASWTHPLYVSDSEYIPFDPDRDPEEYIPEFLAREIGKPIVRWKDSPVLGYEILPNKYFYKYEAPPPAEELLDEFWRLEKEAEGLLAALRRESR